MIDTLIGMGKKTYPVRIEADLLEDIGIIASAFATTVPKYVEEVLRAARMKDMPKAAKITRDKADALGKSKSDS